jgi:methionyl-tRNA formyltransferase
LLPRWRGAAPIHRALMAGDEVTGVTIMKTVLELDAGPVLGSRTVPVTLDDNVGSLHDRLAYVGATLLVELLPRYVAGELAVRTQPEHGITYAHRILRSDEWVDFRQSTWALHNHIRGLSPWPGATARFEGKTMKLWESRFQLDANLEDEQLLPDAPLGTVYLTPDGTVGLRAGDGWLELREIQPAGKRRMRAVDWLRGQRTSQLQLLSMEENE